MKFIYGKSCIEEPRKNSLLLKGTEWNNNRKRRRRRSERKPKHVNPENEMFYHIVSIEMSDIYINGRWKHFTKFAVKCGQTPRINVSVEFRIFSVVGQTLAKIRITSGNIIELHCHFPHILLNVMPWFFRQSR